MMVCLVLLDGFLGFLSLVWNLTIDIYHILPFKSLEVLLIYNPKMVSQASGRISRPSTANLPAPAQKILDPVIDFLFGVLNFFYFFFLCLVNPDQKGTRHVGDGDYNNRTRGDDGGGPGGRLRRNIGRLNRGAGVAAPPAGG